MWTQWISTTNRSVYTAMKAKWYLQQIVPRSPVSIAMWKRCITTTTCSVSMAMWTRWIFIAIYIVSQGTWHRTVCCRESLCSYMAGDTERFVGGIHCVHMTSNTERFVIEIHCVHMASDTFLAICYRDPLCSHCEWHRTVCCKYPLYSARRGDVEIAGWTVDQTIRVRLPSYPHRVWALWW